jgi:SAM-dependent methyltransferase
MKMSEHATVCAGEAEALNERMFDQSSKDYSTERWFDPSPRSPYAYSITRARLLEATQLSPMDDVFELGCGPGTWTRLLAERCAHVTAVDISAVMIERAAQFVKPYNITFVHANILAYEPTRQYDCVVSSRAIEYVADKDDLCRKLAALVADGGRLVIVSKTPLSVWRGRRVLRNLAKVPRHRGVESSQPSATTPHYMQRISPWMLARLLRAHGLEDIAIRPVILGLPVLRGAVDEGMDLPLVPASLAEPVLRAFNWCAERCAHAPQWAMPVILPFSESYLLQARKPDLTRATSSAPQRRRSKITAMGLFALVVGLLAAAVTVMRHMSAEQ